ncbi:MAG TPA: ABC transporter permease, partial [Nonomuraea sp.]|nr:ABC transporter permease [Nonomuraea sp.]
VGGESALLLGLAAADLEELFQLRPDLSARTVAEMSRGLAGPPAGRLDLPGQPGTLAVRVESDAEVPARLVVSDALGVWRDLPLGVLRKGDNRVELDLRAPAGRSGKVAYPLSLRGLVANSPTGLRLAGVSVDGRAVPVPPASDDVPGVAAFGPLRQLGALPVVLTADLAGTLKLGAGQSGRVGVAGRALEVTVVAVVDSMPTAGAGQRALLADLETLQAHELAAARPPLPVTEWWLAAADTTPARTTLRAHPEWDVTAVDQRELAAELRDDPLASGLQGALMLGFAAALGFATLGFLVNGAVAARERRAEFAVLRALGTGSRQMFGLLAVEQAFVIGLSLAAGTGLAVAVGTLVVPHIVLTGQASAVTPGVLLEIPWGAAAALLAATTAVLFAIVAALARRLRRGHVLEDR